MYADLEFYLCKYCQNSDHLIDNQSFALYERKAEVVLNHLTAGRIDDITDDIKYCICEIAEYIYQNKDNENIISESNDGYTVTYAGERFQYDKIYAIAKKYLFSTELLYRGF